MGLDIYLSHYTDFKLSKALEKEYETKSEAIWKKVGKGKKYEELTQEQKDKASAQTAVLAEKLGLGKYGEIEIGKEDIRMTSKIHPKHDCFQVGYFRSSYNDSGINRVLEKMGLPTLYDIFEHDKDEYEFSPDWKAALKKVNEALVAFNHNANGFHGQYDCYDISADSLRVGVTDANQALEVFRKELEGKQAGAKGFDNYSNGFGTFYLGADAVQRVRGFIPGRDVLNRPCLYIVVERVKNEQGEDENLKWYREALEIVRETIEYVLAQKDPQNYYLAWSG